LGVANVRCCWYIRMQRGSLGLELRITCGRHPMSKPDMEVFLTRACTRRVWPVGRLCGSRRLG
jgi:hypothetical protein